VTCVYCGAWNADGEHRCQRCGRRASETTGAAFSATGQALALAAVPVPVRAAPATPAEAAPPKAPQQRNLFVERSQPKVIPFKSPEPPRPPAPRSANKPTQPRKPAGAKQETQRSLDFLPKAPPSRKLKTTVEAVIYCDAPVATKAHRALAAALDLSMMVIACAMFAAGFALAGGEFSLDSYSLEILGGAFALISIFYAVVWLLAATETPGKRWTGLRLINFDGFPPEPIQRWIRFAGLLLGLCSAGIGVLWALVDEESLAWHDHISRTFLTVNEQDTNFFRQQ
jgi:uncharacterized RDD family membrane protein YckC